MKPGEEVTVDLGDVQLKATVLAFSAGTPSPQHPGRVLFPGAVVVGFVEPLETPHGFFREAVVWPHQITRKPGRKAAEKAKEEF